MEPAAIKPFFCIKNKTRFKKMCIYPRLIPNKKYLPNKKNGGNAPEYKDIRTTVVPIGCGKCFECRQQYARDWKIRMYEELRGNMQNGVNSYFATLTFDEERLNHYLNRSAEENLGEIDENEAATMAVREFLERWRKKNGKSLRHWLITELGHENTERLHMHGIISRKEPITNEELNDRWKNGWTSTGEYCNLRTINYITKYITKIDNDHPNFTGKVLCSAGIGDWYFKANHGNWFNQYIEGETKEYYRSQEGYKMCLPIYYRNHIYTEEEREKLWIEKIEKHTTWLDGVEYDIKDEKGVKQYRRGLIEAQKKNKKLGYGKIEWDWDIYSKSIEKINIYNVNKIIQKKQQIT